MKQAVAKINHLSKNYHNSFVLRDISITIEPGKIYGLIGQNGAGKTTLMRVLAGLTFPTEGSIELFGYRDEQALRNERRRLGAMIENPGFIPHMTAKENLTLHRIMRGIPNKEIEHELLELVGLTNSGKKKAKHFSLGMKQRLGIAIALLGSPELLLLDEPINGLDPIGVIEIRTLLKKLCEERQIAILISSHNLPELYQVATNYVIIHQGSIKETLTLEELEEKCKRHIHIRCNQPEKLTSVLEMQLNTRNFKVMPDKSVKLYDYLDQEEIVATTIYNNEIITTKFATDGDTLENYFISAIGGHDDA